MYTSRNIYLVGAGSTGKTTLFKALQRYYAQLQDEGADCVQPAYTSEVARGVVAELGINREDIRGSPERCLRLQRAILEAQHRAEVALEGNLSQWYISDRSGMDPIVMAKLYVGQEAAGKLLEMPEWQYLESMMRNSLVVLCQSISRWLTDDGTRLLPQNMAEWERIDQSFVEVCAARDIPFTLVPRDMIDLSERVRFVVDTHQALAGQIEMEVRTPTNLGSSIFS